MFLNETQIRKPRKADPCICSTFFLNPVPISSLRFGFGETDGWVEGGSLSPSISVSISSFAAALEDRHDRFQVHIGREELVLSVTSGSARGLSFDQGHETNQGSLLVA